MVPGILQGIGWWCHRKVQVISHHKNDRNLIIYANRRERTAQKKIYTKPQEFFFPTSVGDSRSSSSSRFFDRRNHNLILGNSRTMDIITNNKLIKKSVIGDLSFINYANQLVNADWDVSLISIISLRFSQPENTQFRTDGTNIRRDLYLTVETSTRAITILTRKERQCTGQQSSKEMRILQLLEISPTKAVQLYFKY